MDDLFVVIDEEGTVQAAFHEEEQAEAMAESHAYKMRERAIKELGQDGDGNEKDLREAELYAGQSYPIWFVLTVSEKACVAADGEDLTLYVNDCGDVEVNSSEIIKALERMDSDDDDFDDIDF